MPLATYVCLFHIRKIRNGKRSHCVRNLQDRPKTKEMMKHGLKVKESLRQTDALILAAQDQYQAIQNTKKKRFTCPSLIMEYASRVRL